MILASFSVLQVVWLFNQSQCKYYYMQPFCTFLQCYSCSPVSYFIVLCMIVTVIYSDHEGEQNVIGKRINRSKIKLEEVLVKPLLDYLFSCAYSLATCNKGIYCMHASRYWPEQQSLIMTTLNGRYCKLFWTHHSCPPLPSKTCSLLVWLHVHVGFLLYMQQHL